MSHQSVLLKESITALNLHKNSVVVDATLGLGGHSAAILPQITDGFLYGFEIDEKAHRIAQQKLASYHNFAIINRNFVAIKTELNKRQINEVDAILFDLGVSSLQLDDGARGFSFHQTAPLDMRFDPNQTLTAHEIVNNYSKEALIKIFFQYGEEKYSRKIAQAIVTARETKQITTTTELVEIIQNSVPQRYRRQTHPARRVFQAIRIAVNDELNNFEKALYDSLSLLAIHGRLVVITFHSLEDRICQRVFKEVATYDPALKKLPEIPAELQLKYQILPKVKPSKDEIAQNPRARSAKLRILERMR